MSTDLFESELRELLSQEALVVSTASVTAVADCDYRPRARRSFAVPIAATGVMALALTVGVLATEPSGPASPTAHVPPTTQQSAHTVGSMTYVDFLLGLGDKPAADPGKFPNWDLGERPNCIVPDPGKVVRELPEGLIRKQFPPIPKAAQDAVGAVKVDRTYYVTPNAPYVAYLPLHPGGGSFGYLAKPFDGNIEHLQEVFCRTLGR